MGEIFAQKESIHSLADVFLPLLMLMVLFFQGTPIPFSRASIFDSLMISPRRSRIAVSIIES